MKKVLLATLVVSALTGSAIFARECGSCNTCPKKECNRCEKPCPPMCEKERTVVDTKRACKTTKCEDSYTCPEGYAMVNGKKGKADNGKKNGNGKTAKKGDL